MAARRCRPEGQSRCSDFPPSLPNPPGLPAGGARYEGLEVALGSIRGPGQPGSIAAKAKSISARQSPTKGPR